MEDVFPGFTQLLDQEKVKFILSEPSKVSAKFIADIYEDRVLIQNVRDNPISARTSCSPSPNFVNNVSQSKFF
jgi:hypothetical protein